MALLPLFDIARSGLLSQEIGLTVVGNNIANVNTPGYTRERARLGQEIPAEYGSVFLGRGVRVRNVEQVVDPLIDRRLRNVGSDDAYDTARRDALASLASLTSELGESSLSGEVDAFFDAADALARNPAGIPERQTLLGRATALADEFNRRATQLGTLQRDADDRVTALVAEGNDELGRIADLNVAIANQEVTGQSANQLRDERQQVLESLARKVGISVVETQYGGARVSLESGAVLVEEGHVVNPLAAQAGTTAGLDGSPLHDLGISGPSNTFIPLASGYTRGEIAALLSVRDGELVQASTRLDTLATTFAAAVNAVQQDAAALDLDGNATAAVPLFSGTSAATLAVAINDPRRIAAARSTQAGDAANALALSDLRATRFAGIGNVTLTGWLSAEQARLGQQSALAADVATATSLLAEQVKGERDSISGVNLNEELANLLRFQHAFQASARLVNVADSMLEDLVNMIR